jgi:hypothetical protein
VKVFKHATQIINAPPFVPNSQHTTVDVCVAN